MRPRGPTASAPRGSPPEGQGPGEHLVILPERALRRLLRKRVPLLTWSRRRREPPIGAVQARDTIFFKLPGGDVAAQAVVRHIAERAEHGRFSIRMRLRRVTRLPVPFPIVKRDRRSWVVCAPPSDDRQQSLFALPTPTIEQLQAAARRHYGRLPSRSHLAQTARFLLSRGLTEDDRGLLLLLVLLLSVRDRVPLSRALRDLLRRLPTHVHPLAKFARRD